MKVWLPDWSKFGTENGYEGGRIAASGTIGNSIENFSDGLEAVPRGRTTNSNNRPIGVIAVLEITA
jgi:hypothetical protein